MKIIGKRINSNRHFKKPYDTWRNMMQRCYNVNNPYYKNYGGSNITVCERWHNFENFLDDFDKIKGFSDDVFHNKKIFLDKDGKFMSNDQYNLNNCEFISIEESNKRKQHQMKKFKVTNLNNNKVEIFYNQSECAKKLGINQSGISYTLNTGRGNYKGYLFEFIK